MSQSVVNVPSRNPAAPASVSCASEIWPEYPVTTTCDRPNMAKISVVTRAARLSCWRSTSAAPASSAHPIAVVRRLRTRGARPRRRVSSIPRLGSGLARATSTTRIRISGTSSAAPEAGIQECWRLEVGDLGLEHPDGDAAEHRRRQPLEPAEGGDGQGRDDEERVVDRHRRDDRCDEDPGDAGHHRAEHPVGGADPIGGDAADVRPLLALGHRPADQAEAGVAPHRPHEDRDDDHGGRHVHPVLRDGHVAEPRTGRRRRCGRRRSGAVPTRWVIRPTITTETPSEATALGHRRRGAQRPEHEQVQHQAQAGGDRQRQDGRRPEAHPGDLDRLGQARQQEQQLAPAQPRVEGGGEQGDGAHAEVHHLRAAVRDDQREPQRGEHRAVGQPEQQERDVLAHTCPPPPLPALPAPSAPLSRYNILVTPSDNREHLDTN